VGIRYLRKCPTSGSGLIMAITYGKPDVSTQKFTAPLPSGDATGVSDRTNLNDVFTRAATARTKCIVKYGTYVVDVAPTILSNLFVEFENGVVIKVRDKITQVSTWTSGNAVVSVTDATGILAGMHVSDPAANLSTGDAFGGIPYATTVASVSGNNVTLSVAPTTSGSGATLVFHPKTNALKGAGVSNFSLTCPGGWASLDGNYTHSYPYNALSDDANRNALRLISPSDFVIDGIEGINAFYHGNITVGKVSGARLIRWRSRNNGYRAIHFHAEAVTGNATPECRDNYVGRVETDGNGHRAFYTRSADEVNTGIFMLFENCLNTQIDSVLCKNEYGYSMVFAGGPAPFLYPLNAKYAQVGSMISENCGMGISFSSGTQGIQIGNYLGWGLKLALANSVFYSAASATEYYVDAVGTVGSVKTRVVDVAAGSIVANNLRAGMRVFASGGTTGMTTAGVLIWRVSVGTGASGKDQLFLFNDLSPASDPYTTAGTATMYVRGSRGNAVEFYAATGQTVRDIKFGSITLYYAGKYGINTQLSNSEYRYSDISFGDVSITGCSSTALNIGSMKEFSFNSLHEMDNASGFDNGGVSGSYDSALFNCALFTINNFRRTKTSTFSNDNEAIRVDSYCRSGVIYPTSVSLSSTAPAIKVQTPSGAGVNSAGITGAIVLVNPTDSTGAAMTVANSQINRVDATACIVTRPVDA
jgi:hypothetical protein